MPTVDIPSGQHGLTGYLAVPDAGRGPGVVVIQEIFGLDQYVQADVARDALFDAAI